jgi:Tol biopolymer transport system component/DNA-binding winged helix-turn-helix (wHTH) protein
VAHLYRFDDVEIDLRGFRVLKAGKVVSLEPKALNVLVFLVENRERLVEKRELLDAVWGEAFVTENVLTRAIGQLRKVLVDDVKRARYIETVPTRGYRFIADVNVKEIDDAEAAIPPRREAAFPSGAAPSVHLEQTHPHLRRYAVGAVAIVALACLIVIAISVARSRSTPRYLQVASNKQITTSNGLSFYPSFSPDGTEIAYCTDRGKGFEIFVRQLVPGGKEFQITSDGNQNMQPAWSPDSNFIAYYSKTRGGIWLVPALGGTARKLTDFGSHPAWSRDGQLITFQSSALDDLGADNTGANPPSTIWAVRPDGNNAKEITSPGNPEGGHGAPSWSPDAKHIVFVASLHGGSSVWSIGADGTGLARLASRAYGHYDPVYSPDGKSVLYGAVGAGTNYGLWQVRVSPDTSSALEQPVQIMNSGGTRIKNLAFSADGKKLVYASVSLSGSLQSLPAAKSVEPVGEPVTLTSDAGCRSILPAFSPDGSRVAFNSCRGRAGLPQQVWSMSADGSNLQQLTFGPSLAAYPAWYPDGRRILFQSGGKLISVDSDTRQQKVIMELKQDSGEFRLSPDGMQVAITSSISGVINIWLIDLATGKLKQLTFDKEMAGFPAWSPDGKFIAAEIQRGVDNSIVILPSAGGAVTQLTPYQGQHWLYSWSPDGDKVLFAKQGEDAIWNLWSVSRLTKTEKQLTHYMKLNAYVRYPSISPRGDQIVYEYTETTGNIWMVGFK